jgi:microcystin-dependent protein
MSEPFIAEVRIMGFNFAPRGWAFCDGQLLAISQNTALFSLVGTTYGGDGRVTFGLPDIRGRAAVHPGTGPGLTQRRLGQKGGTETVTLTANQIPSHNHALRATPDSVVQSDPANQLPAKTSQPTYGPAGQMAGLNSSAVTNTGGSQHHETRQPWLAVYYCIALVGTFPSSSLSVFKKLRQQLIPKLRLIPSVCLENTGC